MDNENRQFFHTVPGLAVPRQSNLNSEVLANITQYINTAQSITDSIKKNLEYINPDNLIRNIEAARKLLQSIYAKGLTANADAILKALKTDDIKFYIKFTPALITDMLALSIALQLAQEQAETQGSGNTQSEVERCSNIISSLDIIETLVSSGDFESASNVLTDMEGMEDSNHKNNLMHILQTEQETPAINEIFFLKTLYKDKIMRFGGSEDGTLKKVMAVDDRPEILSSLAAVLKGHYKVFPAISGNVALKMLEKQQPDLFILDIEMPGMDGFALARVIRSMPEYVNTRILFLTSNATKEYVVGALQAGGNDFIVKPINQDMLLAKIGQHI